MTHFWNLKKFILVLFVFILKIHSSAFAESFFYLEAGGMISPINRVTSSNSASTSLLGSKQILIGLSSKFYNFKPGIDYTIFGRSGPGDTHKSKTLILELPYVSLVGEGDRGGELKTGLVVWMNKISGKGGDITLPNGTSTSTFSRPGRTVNTRNLGIVIGYEMPLTEEFAFDFDAHILAPLTAKRTFNLLLQLSWRMY